MIYDGGKAGHPWHGSWASTTGKITTPGGGEINCPGQPPKVRLGGSSSRIDTAHAGDCFKAAIPGQPAVTTTPEEALAGKTWLNYALISGARHRLFGIELGFNRWIYVAPDKTRWIADVGFAPPDMNGAHTVLMAFSLTRFGEFSQTSTGANNQLFGNTTVNLALDRGALDQSDYPLNGTVAARAYVDIEDIRSDGAAMLFAAQSDLVIDAGCPLCRRVIFSIKELRITGTPPNASIEVVTVAATSDIRQLTILDKWQKFKGMIWYKDANYADKVWVGPATDSAAGAIDAYLEPTNLANFVGGNNTEPWSIGWPDDIVGVDPAHFFSAAARYAYLDKIVVAARYNPADGRVEKVVAETSWDISFSRDIIPVPGSAHQWSGTGSLSGSGAIKLKRIDVLSGSSMAELASYSLSCAASWGGNYPGNATWSGNCSVNGATTAISNTAATFAEYFSPVWSVNPPLGYTFGSILEHGDGAGQMFSGAATQIVYPLRYSNAVCGLVQKSLPSNAYSFWGVAGKIGADGTSISGSAGSWPVHVSEHPDSGDILRATTPVSWV